MFKRFPIRRKLAAALVLPLVIANAVTLFEAFRSRQTAHQAVQQANLATASLGPNGVVTGLRLESSVTAVVVIGLPASVLGQGTLPAERARVDAAISQVAPFVRSHGAAAVAAYQPVLQALGTISALRAEVDDYHGQRSLSSPTAIALAAKVVNQYDAVIQTVLDANTTLTLGISDDVLRNGAELLDADARSSQFSGALTTQIGLIVESGQTPSTTQLLNIADANGRFLNTQTRVSQLATGVYASAAPRSQAPFQQVIQQILTGQKVNLQELVSGALGSGSKDPSNVGTVNTASAIVTARANSLRNQSRTREYEYGALAIAALLMAYGSALLAGRSIGRPLRKVTADAEDMAGTRLPATVQEILSTPITAEVRRPDVQPITVRTRDEVADLATALNTVQGKAVDLAIEQAELRRRSAQSFVDLGRRNQNLIGRQLDFITELEQRETNPETLENLFRLDHLATRMRRNAESLLVLAGLEPSRPWSAPVALSDVVRAALGEVEDYQRVSVREMRGVMVTGPSSGDLVHLVAELLENALTFSPPESQVEILGRPLPEGYALSVMDEGLGMTPQERDAANARLSQADRLTGAPSRHLGLQVAASVAGRLDVKVSLHEGPTGGTVARLILPEAILAPSSEPAPDAGAVRGAFSGLAVSGPVFSGPATALAPPTTVGPAAKPGLPAVTPPPAPVSNGATARNGSDPEHAAWNRFMGRPFPGTGLTFPELLPAAPQEPAMDEPVPDEPVPDEPVLDEPVPDEPVPDEPPTFVHPSAFVHPAAFELPAEPEETPEEITPEDVPPITRNGLSRRVRPTEPLADEQPIIPRGLGEPTRRSEDRSELFKFLSGYQQATVGAGEPDNEESQ